MASSAKRALVLMNLGSPDSTEVKDVKRYLTEFLMDERVIDKSYLARLLLVRGLIVPFRAPKSAEAYKSVWTPDGSPLIVLTKQLQQALQSQVAEPIAIAMRYGNPSPKMAYDELLKSHPELEEVLLLPLYPHYAMSSYETAVEFAKKQHRENGYSFKLSVIKPFYDDVDYIDALVQSMEPYLQQDHDHVLFSYHGVPQRHILKGSVAGTHCLEGDTCCGIESPVHEKCYRHQLLETTRLVVEKLRIPKEKYSISFQSRLGKGWLEPFTDKRLEAMPGEGIKKLVVVCPAFISDCLETIEEMGEEGKETFMHAGGESYTLIPCLNTHPAWTGTIAGWMAAYRDGSQAMILAS